MVCLIPEVGTAVQGPVAESADSSTAPDSASHSTVISAGAVGSPGAGSSHTGGVMRTVRLRLQPTVTWKVTSPGW